jgi:hypothetical protein
VEIQGVPVLVAFSHHSDNPCTFRPIAMRKVPQKEKCYGGVPACHDRCRRYHDNALSIGSFFTDSKLVSLNETERAPLEKPAVAGFFFSMLK